MKSQSNNPPGKRVHQSYRSEIPLAPHSLKILVNELKHVLGKVQACKESAAAFLDKVPYEEELLEKIGCARSRLHFLQSKVLRAQHRLQGVQQQVDDARCNVRQRAQMLLGELSKLQTSATREPSHTTAVAPDEASTERERNALLARLAILFANLYDYQKNCVSQLFRILPLKRSRSGLGQRVSISNLSLPLTLKEVQLASRDKRHLQEKELTDALGYLTVLMDLLSRLFELPLLYQSRYGGHRTIIWEPTTFWELSPFEDKVHCMYITKKDGSGQDLDYHNVHLHHAFVALQRSAGLLVQNHPLVDELSNNGGYSPFLLLAALCNSGSALVASFLTDPALGISLSRNNGEHAFHSILMHPSVEGGGRSSGVASSDDEWEELSPGSSGEDADGKTSSSRPGLTQTFASALAKYRSQAVKYLNLQDRAFY